MKNMTMGNMTTDGMDGHDGHDMSGGNMTMNGMDGHDGHDMSGGHHTSTDDHTLMKNYFHLSAQAIVLFIGWETMTWAGECSVK